MGDGTGTLARLAGAQGAYFAAAGVWPLLHMRSFEAITGPKLERWLVRTVAVLVLAIGGTLATAAARRRVTPELGLLAASSAAGLAAVDTWYAARRRISPIYLADAAVEVALVSAWVALGRPARKGGEEER